MLLLKLFLVSQFMYEHFMQNVEIYDISTVNTFLKDKTVPNYLVLQRFCSYIFTLHTWILLLLQIKAGI